MTVQAVNLQTVNKITHFVQSYANKTINEEEFFFCQKVSC